MEEVDDVPLEDLETTAEYWDRLATQAFYEEHYSAMMWFRLGTGEGR